MPTTPAILTLTGTSVDVLNAIRNSASINYRNYVPVATPDADCIRKIGAVIMDFPSLQNEFINALINRIGLVILSNKTFDNPLRAFKRGVMEYGETVEEIFVELAKPFDYNPTGAASTFMAREIPDVRASFHVVNYQKFYKQTIQPETLKKAFLSWGAMDSLIEGKIVEALYTGANYDEYLTMKYLLAQHILEGHVYPVQISGVDAANAAAAVTTIKAVSNQMTFLSDKYNIAHVRNSTEKNDQYMLINSAFDAIVDVNVLASAFNMDKAQFMGHRVLVDSFGALDTARLDVLFANDPNYTTLTSAQLSALDAIPAVIVDKDWFMVFDNLIRLDSDFNGEGLYWNYWYHVWKTFSVSPFSNAACFVAGAPVVSAVSVTPATASVVNDAEHRLTCTAEVTNAYFAPKAVDWTVDSDGKAAGITVDKRGNVYIPKSAAADSYTITATATVPTAAGGSTYAYDTCVITVSAPSSD